MAEDLIARGLGSYTTQNFYRGPSVHRWFHHHILSYYGRLFIVQEMRRTVKGEMVARITVLRIAVVQTLL